MDTETRLLDNMLDALDRLYDQRTSAIDVQALAEATAAALPNHDLAAVLSDAADSLDPIVRSGLPMQDENRAALVATDDLRLRLAAL